MNKKEIAIQLNAMLKGMKINVKYIKEAQDMIPMGIVLSGDKINRELIEIHWALVCALQANGDIRGLARILVDYIKLARDYLSGKMSLDHWQDRV